jgi:hypothetical protein
MPSGCFFENELITLTIGIYSKSERAFRVREENKMAAKIDLDSKPDRRRAPKNSYSNPVL